MTNKVIIDGVDVSECEYYRDGFCYPGTGVCYKCDTICSYACRHYKEQLQRKEQECEELNEDIQGLKTNLLEKENCSARYYQIVTHREQNELYKKFDYQRTQKEKFKQALEKIEEYLRERDKNIDVTAQITAMELNIHHISFLEDKLLKILNVIIEVKKQCT